MELGQLLRINQSVWDWEGQPGQVCIDLAFRLVKCLRFMLDATTFCSFWPLCLCWFKDQTVMFFSFNKKSSSHKSWKWNFRAICRWKCTRSSLSCCLAILSPCGFVGQVYRDSEPSPMVCCDLCEHWVHCGCDGIRSVISPSWALTLLSHRCHAFSLFPRCTMWKFM